MTTPIFYPSGRPHIGHAYSLYWADSLVRAHRQLNRGETYFATGTDEHGEKLQRVAERAQVSPQAWVDQIVAEAWQPFPGILGVQPDQFVRTSDPRHVKTVQNFLQVLHERGHIYLGEHRGSYCVECEEKKTSSDLYKDARGQLLCQVHLIPVTEISETNYFFRLSAFAPQLLELIETNPQFIQPASARNEVLSLLKSGLEDLSISRNTFQWGIPVPWDAEHVVYVWFDALLNYVSSLGYDGASDTLPALYGSALHLIGKDILRFHAIVLPALLLAHGLELPRGVLAHGWLLSGTDKIAKSKGNSVDPAEIVQRFGSDALRYHLLRAIPLGSDGSFAVEDLETTYTSILGNSYGNLVRRLSTLLQRHGAQAEASAPTAAEISLIQAADNVRERILAEFDPVRGIASRIELAETLLRETNSYLTQQAPWQLVKDSSELAHVQQILTAAAYACVLASWALAPVLPETSLQALAAFGFTETEVPSFEALLGRSVLSSPLLFPRL